MAGEEYAVTRGFNGVLVCSRSTEILSLFTMEWRKGPDLPEDVSDPSGTAIVGSDMYVKLGRNKGTKLCFRRGLGSDSLERFDKLKTKAGRHSKFLDWSIHESIRQEFHDTRHKNTYRVSRLVEKLVRNSTH